MDAIEIIGVLKRYRNVVLHGPPGTGKTWVFGQVCSSWESVTGRPVAEPPLQLTLHPSTAYEDIIDGLRPNPAGDPPFEPTLGIFAKICEDARKEPGFDHLVLFDELNRANVPRVLGDLLTMLEPSKRAPFNDDQGRFDDPPGGSVTLAYSRVPFVVPGNLYLLATMNSSDRAIVSIDVAVRRRFAFVRTEPMPGATLINVLNEQYGGRVTSMIAPSINVWDRLNEVLRRVLGPDSVLGHSYFFDLSEQLATTDADRRTIPKRMWHETGKLTSAARNQLDLAKSGKTNGLPGSVTFFFPEVTGDLDETSVRSIKLDWDGKTFQGNTVQYEQGNKNWRLFMNGTSESGESLTTLIKEHDLRHSIVWFIRIGMDHYELNVASESLEELQEATDWDVTSYGTGGRHYGFEEGETAVASDIEMAWRFVLLPQLIETLSLSDAEALGDSALRAEWLHGASVGGADQDVINVLESFDDFLAQFRVALTMRGSGLMKRLSIVDGHSVPAPAQSRERDEGSISHSGDQEDPDTTAST